MKKVNVTFEECNAEDLIKIASILGGAPVQIEKSAEEEITEEKQTEDKPKETAAQKKKRLAAEKKAKEEAQKAAEELAKAEAEKAAAEDDAEMTFGVEEEEEGEEEGEEEVEPVDTKVLNKLMSDKMAANPDYKVQIVSRVTKTYKVKKVSELSPEQNVDFYKFLKGLK